MTQASFGDAALEKRPSRTWDEPENGEQGNPGYLDCSRWVVWVPDCGSQCTPCSSEGSQSKGDQGRVLNIPTVLGSGSGVHFPESKDGIVSWGSCDPTSVTSRGPQQELELSLHFLHASLPSPVSLFNFIISVFSFFLFKVVSTIYPFFLLYLYSPVFFSKQELCI